MTIFSTTPGDDFLYNFFSALVHLVIRVLSPTKSHSSVNFDNYIFFIFKIKKRRSLAVVFIKKFLKNKEINDWFGPSVIVDGYEQSFFKSLPTVIGRRFEKNDYEILKRPDQWRNPSVFL